MTDIGNTPRTASDIIQDAAWRVNWKPDEKHSEQARYDALCALQGIHAYSTVIVLETLRRIDPAAAERVAQYLDNAFDWDCVRENAWAWEQALANGESIDAHGEVFPALVGQEDRS